ncbi:uncharacterized [Tachysurus ichikawai]
MCCSELECEELHQICGNTKAIQMEKHRLNTKPEKPPIFFLLHTTKDSDPQTLRTSYPQTLTHRHPDPQTLRLSDSDPRTPRLSDPQTLTLRPPDSDPQIPRPPDSDPQTPRL